MEARLKYAIDTVLDAFDDAVLNVPEETEEQRTAALLNNLVPRLIERGARFAKSDPNPDLDATAKAKLMELMQHVMMKTPNIAAVVVLRIMTDGSVHSSGGAKNLRDGAVEEMAEICRMALSELAAVRMAAGKDICDCKSCRDRRKRLPFGGQIPQA